MSSDGSRVELRMARPKRARSVVVERRPPVDTETPASRTNVAAGSPGITHRCHSDSGGVDELDELMLSGQKMSES